QMPITTCQTKLHFSILRIPARSAFEPTYGEIRLTFRSGTASHEHGETDQGRRPSHNHQHTRKTREHEQNQPFPAETPPDHCCFHPPSSCGNSGFRLASIG